MVGIIIKSPVKYQQLVYLALMSVYNNKWPIDNEAGFTA